MRRVAADGTITTVAGNGQYGYNGDGIPATLAHLHSPADAVWDAGNVYIADDGNHRVRKVDTTGTITTVAGAGGCGFGGDGGPATAAPLCSPSRVLTDDAGNLIVSAGDRVRMVGSLLLRMSHGADPVPAGGPLTYTLRAENHGDAGLRGHGHRHPARCPPDQSSRPPAPARAPAATSTAVSAAISATWAPTRPRW